ncbi:type I glyceraldehyde-3-phosphate dehydrogenase [Candidatus Saccharibacteria bacterium SW_7_54_9]|nr:MAG: type I glyceraldehyde-3-phosphate dehydrogenase [Candidatus Saccharibacteria bacterium SW_7_54_9]
MKTKIAINGFGRIGRNAFKVAYDREDVEVVALNDLTDNATLAHLLGHDSNYGIYPRRVESDENHVIVDENPIQTYAEKDPSALPWSDLDIDVVIESTGRFTNPEDAQMHITAGAKQVVISAPAKGDGADTIVLGVNDEDIRSSGEIVSNASCTTNSITPVAGLMVQHFGVEKAMMTTIHSYTADQSLQDGPHRDLRRARSAAENIVPTTTGATIAAQQALPQLEGVFDGLSIRVPTPVGSLSDFTFVLQQDTTVEEVNQVMRQAAQSEAFKNILAVTDEPLVSRDMIGNSHSAIVDLGLTQVCGGNLAKIVAWYDNEWGYSNRLIELASQLGARR